MNRTRCSRWPWAPTRVGFIFAPSPRQIAPTIARDIARRLPPEIITVGVFRDESSKRVVEIVNSMGLRGAQLHGHESPARGELGRPAGAVHDQGVRRHRPPARQGRPVRGRRAASSTRPTPGSGQVFDWSLAERAPGRPARHPRRRPHPRERRLGHRDASAPGASTCRTGVESSPGKKDALKMRYFINNAKAYEDDDECEDYVEPRRRRHRGARRRGRRRPRRLRLGRGHAPSTSPSRTTTSPDGRVAQTPPSSRPRVRADPSDRGGCPVLRGGWPTRRLAAPRRRA